jgi:hypothetical protein
LLVATQVTLLHEPVLSKLRHLKSTAIGANAATVAKRLVDDYQTVLFSLGNGIFRAGSYTRWFNTMQTGK